MVINLLKSLFPKGSPWNLLGEFGKLITGIGTSINRVFLYANETLAESNPSTTTDLLQNWFDSLGLKNEPNLSLVEKRRILNTNYIGTGGQSKEYIQTQIQKVFPDITIEEYVFPVNSMTGYEVSGVLQVSNYPSWIPIQYQDGSYPVFLYKVSGTVDNVTQYLILQDLIKRYAPLTHIPVYVNINFYSNTGMVGVGQVGISEVGRNQT
jgi:uncharacterized protein YmfQ (DUF2313 family)